MPASLGASYYGWVGFSDTDSIQIDYQLKNADTATLSCGNKSVDVNIKMEGKTRVFMTDFGNVFELTGELDQITGVISGDYQHPRGTKKANFYFKKAPTNLKPQTSESEGRMIFLCVGGCGSLLALIVCVVHKKGSAHTRMYLAKVMSLTLTLFVGLIGVDMMNAMFTSTPELREIMSHTVRAVIFLCFLVVGWLGMTLVCFKQAKKPLYRMLTSTIIADFVSFIGIFGFDCLWKTLVVRYKATPDMGNAKLGIYCALAVWAISIAVLMLLYNITKLARLRIKQDQSQARSTEAIEEKLPEAEAPGRTCAVPDFTSLFKTKEPEKPKEPKQINNWEGDCKWAENTVVATIEAFIVFKLCKVIIICWGDSWYGSLIVFMIVIGLLVAGIVQLKTKGGNDRFEHIFMAAALRLMGLEVLSAIAWLVVSKTQMGSIICNFLVFTFSFTLCIAIMFALGFRADKMDNDSRPKKGKNPEDWDEKHKKRKEARKGGEEFGIFHVPSQADKDSNVKVTGSKEPMEIAAMAIMLAVSLFNCLEDIIVAISLEIPGVQHHQTLFKGIIAVLVTVGTWFIWRKMILPSASRRIKDFNRDVKNEKKDEKSMKHLKVHEDDSEDSSSTASSSD